MTAEAFRQLTAARAAQHPPLLHALWHEANGNWNRAHEIAQDIESADGAWVHAYLHRREGDEWNAAYWYRRGHRPACKLQLDDEWIQIVEEMLSTPAAR